MRRTESKSPKPDCKEVLGEIDRLYDDGQIDVAKDVLQSLVEGLVQRVADLEFQLQKAKNQKFGRKSEKTNPAQLIFKLKELGGLVPEGLIERLEQQAQERREKAEQDRKKKSDSDGPGDSSAGGQGDKTKKNPGPSRGPNTKGIDLRRVVQKTIELPPADQGEIIGYELTTTLNRVPGYFELIVYKRPKTVDRSDRRAAPVVAPAPDLPFDGGRPGASLLADIVTQKYAWHLPLYRIRDIYRRDGYHAARSTLVRYVGRVASMLGPIAEAILKEALEAVLLQTDDTGVRVLDPEKLKGTKKGHLWAYLGDHTWLAFDYTPDWKADRPREILADRVGILQADAYKGYDKLFLNNPDLIEYGCNAHNRRGFFDARTVDSRAHIALGLYSQIYQVERQAKELVLPPDEIVKLRLEKAEPIFVQFREWLTRVEPTAPPKTPLGAAIGYMTNQWDALTAYLTNGNAEIDNTAVEREMRPIGVGRRNWLQCGSDEGGENAAVLYSVVGTARLARLDVFAYLNDVITKIASGWKSKDLHELLPPVWAQQHPQHVHA